MFTKRNLMQTKVVHLVKQQNKRTNVDTKITNQSVRYPDRLVGCPLGVPISYYREIVWSGGVCLTHMYTCTSNRWNFAQKFHIFVI